jgi:hypothetical protein
MPCLLCGPDWPGTCSSPGLASQVLEFQAYSTRLGFYFLSMILCILNIFI